jgi:hypothetical protein
MLNLWNLGAVIHKLIKMALGKSYIFQRSLRQRLIYDKQLLCQKPKYGHTNTNIRLRYKE